MAKPVFRIPKEHLESFEVLTNLSDSTREALLQESETRPPRWSASEFLEEILENESIPRPAAEAFVRIASSLFATAEGTSQPIPDLLESTVAGVAEGLPEILSSDQKRNELLDFLGEIFRRGGNFAVTSKAAFVAFSHERPFVAARILTDLRPIFHTQELDIATAVPMHSLMITTRENDANRSRYFALDRSDLQQLRDQIDRALAKEAVLRDKLGKAGIECLRLAD